MCAALGIQTTPWEVAEQGEYWQHAIVAEYEISQDPQVQQFYEKQQKKAEAERRRRTQRDKDRERERHKSRERAGENHLESIDT